MHEESEVRIPISLDVLPPVQIDKLQVFSDLAQRLLVDVEPLRGLGHDLVGGGVDVAGVHNEAGGGESEKGVFSGSYRVYQSDACFNVHF